MRDSQSLRRRIEAVLARRPGGGGPGIVGGTRPRRYSRLPEGLRSARGTREPGASWRRPVVLEDEVDGETVRAPGGGPVWLVRREGPAPVRPAGLDPSSLLFFDIEATGLSCSPLFLIGAMIWEADRLEVRQYLARDYSEEAAAITLFLAEAGRRERLVSFNGKSYDLPYIRMRAAATGVPCALDPPHLDLLHSARRAWCESLPDCRLQTLEREILGKPRGTADIPGADIPDAYHAFVRTRDARDIVRILAHNQRDLSTLAELLVLLPEELR